MPRDRPENHYGRQALIRGICDCRTFELNSGFLLRRDLFPRRQDSAGVVFDPVGEHAHVLRDLFAHRGQAVFHMRRYNREGLRSEEHTSELQSLAYLVCRLLLEKKKQMCRG